MTVLPIDPRRNDGPPPPDSPEPALRLGFPLTDTGNAERLVQRHGQDLHYIAPWNKWLVWDGRRWRLDDTLEVHRRAKDTVRAIWLEAADTEDKARKRDIVKWATTSESAARLASMLDRARAEPGIAIRTDDLDPDPWKITVENGMLDLRTFSLEPHHREDMSTKLVPAPFDFDAECPRWEAFLDRVMNGNKEMITFLQRAVGYSLTGSTKEQCLFFLYGEGANGKSTFLEILRILLNDYATQADFTTFLEKKGDGPRNDVARLFGARVVTSSEVGEGKRLNESLVKSLTGSDTIAARYLYAETFEFKPTFKLWLAANHRPIIRGTDPAIWRRFRLIPFTVQIPEQERDPQLLEALRAELPGILTWAVGGCHQWQLHGLGVPQEVREATDAYRRDSDTLGAFLEDACELDATASTPAKELYDAYAKWADEGGEFKLSQTAFGRRLEERGIIAEKRHGGVKWRRGVRLLHRDQTGKTPQYGSSQPHRTDSDDDERRFL